MSPTSTVSPVHQVPKLIVKVPKENDVVPPLPVFQKLNIKPVLPPQSESASSTSVSSSSSSSSSSEHSSPSTSPLKKQSTGNEDEEAAIVIPKVTIKTIDDEVSTPKVTLKPIPKPVELCPILAQPLEIVTSTKVVESGQDSPRIILKINKGSSTTTEATPKKPQSPVVTVIEDSNDEKPLPKIKNDMKRPHQEPVEEVAEPKKQKIVNHVPTKEEDEDVIIVNSQVEETKKVEEMVKPTSKIQESQANFKEILRMTRQKHQQMTAANEIVVETNKNGKHEKHEKHDKLTSKLLAEIDTGSSSDCMIIDEPIVVVEKLDSFSIANHKKRLSEEYTRPESPPVIKRLRGRPKKTPIIMTDERSRTEDEDSQSCQTDPLALPPVVEEEDDSNQIGGNSGDEDGEDSSGTADSKGTPR